MPDRAHIWRDRHGVPHVVARSEPDLYWGQGVVHATDRGLQMLLMRILGQGRVSEVLRSDDSALSLDTFFRRMNWAAHTARQIEALNADSRECLDAYCEGVNSVLARRRPWELRLFGYRPETWRVDDIVMLFRVISYVSLQSSQAQMERLLVEMVQAGIEEERLHELFPGILAGLDVELLKKVTLRERVVPADVLWQTIIPRPTASNNWVLSGKKTVSGKPLLANDPHLEGNRLPNVWCEVALHIGDRFMMGGSMPGGPGVMLGRNNDVAWGVTYAFLDAVDSWVEYCRDGKYYRQPDEWRPFASRTEVIRRKGKAPVSVTFFENEHGLLDGDPYRQGYYLATRWAAGALGGRSINRFLRMWSVTTVEEAMRTLGEVESAWNYVFADRHGNIGYQMTGTAPVRRAGASGFVPLPGWESENDWQGFQPLDALPAALNPAEGFLITANNDLNDYSRARPLNMTVGPDRAERIRQLLSEDRQYAPRDMFAMQFDVRSLQAEAFLAVLRPLLPDTPQGRILADWDCCYTERSEGAYLFEEFYWRLMKDVFGAAMGEAVIDFLSRETAVFTCFHHHFDRLLLAEHSAWHGGRSREEWFRRAAETALRAEPRPWGESRRYALRHLLFGGKLPRWLGFDRGPVPAIGSRSTVHQGQTFRSVRRETAYVPSYRIVADMATDELHTNLEGGPSDRRFSRWYCSDLANWLAGRYKALTPHPQQPKQRFP
ncbi:MAG: penicillin acylase family protein [Thermoguttaceae bacterium]|nr:penicillin acylase family protein [Thermoguttaceae bacterium]